MYADHESYLVVTYSFSSILYTGTKVCEKLSDIIESTSLVKDAKKLSSGNQTSSLESFQGVINHFAPKLKAYGYYGMTSR